MITRWQPRSSKQSNVKGSELGAEAEACQNKWGTESGAIGLFYTLSRKPVNTAVSWAGSWRGSMKAAQGVCTSEAVSSPCSSLNMEEE